MLYSASETAWLDLRAEKISEERGWPLPIARSEAELPQEKCLALAIHGNPAMLKAKGRRAQVR
jgi:hypothetical protein